MEYKYYSAKFMYAFYMHQCSAAASGRLPPSAVEVVPSRAAAVLLTSVHYTFTSVLQSRDVASGRRRWWLRIRGGACWRAVSLVGRGASSRAPVRRIVRDCR